MCSKAVPQNNFIKTNDISNVYPSAHVSGLRYFDSILRNKLTKNLEGL